MSPVSGIGALLALAVVFVVTSWIASNPRSRPVAHVNSSLDGLRGIAAVLVFLHHSAVWYFYLRTGRWELPPSRLYAHFGVSSVSFFFMMTSFLFYSKLLNHATRPIDWRRLYVTRVLRLVPLYLFALFLVALVVGQISHFSLQVPVKDIVQQSICWIGFTIPGTPNLNGVESTATILAGVAWSLPYEWFFYFFLPVLALFARVRVAPHLLLVGGLTVVEFICWQPEYRQLRAFLSGIVVAYLIRVPAIQRWVKGRTAAGSMLAIVAGVAVFRQADHSLLTTGLLTLAFLVVAGGNSIFGLMTHAIPRQLGQMAYSIYLLHGLLLYLTYRFIIGYSRAATFSGWEHWAVTLICAMIFPVVCQLTYAYIEAPPMRWVPSERARIPVSSAQV